VPLIIIYLYADDIPLYVEVAVADAHSALNRLSDCVSDVKDWCSSRRLQLNDVKTDIGKGKGKSEHL